MAWLCGVLRQDRRHAVPHPDIVQKNCVEGFHQCESIGDIAPAVVDFRRAALHVLAVHKDDTDPIDTIAVHAFGCGQAGGVGPGLDAELMGFRVPGCSPC